jgi:cell division protein FtsI/penicillin-binding protein 2
VGAAGTATVRVEVGAAGVGMASTDVEEVVTGAATGSAEGGVAVAIQPHTADALVMTSRADATPQALMTQSCAADCRAAALEHWQA